MLSESARPSLRMRKTNRSDERRAREDGEEREEGEHSLTLPDSFFTLYHPSIPSNTLLSNSSLLSTTLGTLNRSPMLSNTPEYSLLVSSTLQYSLLLSTTPCDSPMLSSILGSTTLYYSQLQHKKSTALYHSQKNSTTPYYFLKHSLIPEQWHGEKRKR